MRMSCNCNSVNDQSKGIPDMKRRTGVGRGILGAALIGLLASMAAGPAAAEELNLYSARHYQTDEALYADFTAATGIEINRIEGKDDALIERIRNEGANSPADILITVDAGRLWRADQAGLFQPVSSKVLEDRVPANLRHPDGHWFGFSSRARLIFYNRDAVGAGEIARYEDLVANFARDPKGGDTDQLRSVAAGQCDVAVANSYYYARLASSDKVANRDVAAALGVVFPNQGGRGTHINISGAGVLKHAPNRDAAVKFLEYLASDAAQRYFADGNNEYPVVEGVAPNAVLSNLGAFKVDPLNVAVYGENQPEAQKIFDRAGWK